MKQMMDAAAINRLFLSKKPRIPVVVTAQLAKIFFISADQSINSAKGTIMGNETGTRLVSLHMDEND